MRLREEVGPLPDVLEGGQPARRRPLFDIADPVSFENGREILTAAGKQGSERVGGEHACAGAAPATSC